MFGLITYAEFRPVLRDIGASLNATASAFEVMIRLNKKMHARITELETRVSALEMHEQAHREMHYR